MSSASKQSREMHYFAMLSRDEQHAAIHRLAASGMNDYGIAAATRLSVEMVRAILGAVALGSRK